MHRFLTGRAPAGGIAPETMIELNGRVTRYEGGVPTNLGVGGVAVTLYEIDPVTGLRRGVARHVRTTESDGAWGPFVARPDTCYEVVVAAPGQPMRHTFRSPFPRPSPIVHIRLMPDVPPEGQGLAVFTRPRGYVAEGRDAHLLDGKPVPGVKAGIPSEGSFAIPFAGPERAMTAVLNGEVVPLRAIPGAVAYIEFHY